MMQLATWNVNSLAVRLEQVLAWMAAANVDVLALQETKLIDEKFPREVFSAQGYSVVFSGQKTYNGVAIISRYPIHDVITDVDGFVDPQRRILAASIGELRLINLYIPNGAMVGSDKYQYKLSWLTEVTRFIQAQMQLYPNVAVVGDFNIAPTDLDVHDPQAWEGSVLVSDAERAAFNTLIAMGLKDACRHLLPNEQLFTWWDYRAAAFRRNLGLRIDHILLSDALCQHCVEFGVDKAPRKDTRPSDHAPVWTKLNIELVK